MPGVLIFFEIRNVIHKLDRAERGDLFTAILDYAEKGTEPELTGALDIVWPLVKSKLDFGIARYQKRVVKNTYAGYCNACKLRNETPLSFEKWNIERYHAISDDNKHNITIT